MVAVPSASNSLHYVAIMPSTARKTSVLCPSVSTSSTSFVSSSYNTGFNKRKCCVDVWPPCSEQGSHHHVAVGLLEVFHPLATMGPQVLAHLLRSVRNLQPLRRPHSWHPTLCLYPSPVWVESHLELPSSLLSILSTTSFSRCQVQAWWWPHRSNKWFLNNLWDNTHTINMVPIPQVTPQIHSRRVSQALVLQLLLNSPAIQAQHLCPSNSNFQVLHLQLWR